MTNYNNQDELCGGATCAASCTAAGAALLTVAQTGLGTTLVPADTATCEYVSGGGTTPGTTAVTEACVEKPTCGSDFDCSAEATKKTATASTTKCAAVRRHPPDG
jgi:hypothetical protein